MLTTRRNGLFMIRAVKESEAKQAFVALQARLKERGISEIEFAKGLNLSKQRFHNWKSRGIPANQFKTVADALRISVDELLGGKGFKPSFTVPILSPSERARAFAAEWWQLEEPMRSQIQTMVETLIAEQRRKARKAKSGQKAEKFDARD